MIREILPDYYEVSLGGLIYEIDTRNKTPTCTCRGWTFCGHCKHIQVLNEYLKEKQKP